MALWKIYVVILIPMISISVVIRYLVSTNKVKSNKISRLFYNDDKSFINSWKKTEEKGFLSFTFNNIIISIAIMGVLGIFAALNKRSIFGYEQNQIFVALLMGVIFGLIHSLIWWIANQVRVRQIEEKATVESDKVDSTKNNI